VKQAAAAAAPALSSKGPSWLLFPAVLVWLLVVLINYKAKNNFFLVNPFDTPLWLAYFHKGFELFKYAPQLALAGVFSLFAFFTGGLLLKAVAGADNRDIGGLDWLLFSLGLGFGALSLLTLGLGFAGLLTKGALLALLGAGLAAGAARFKADFSPQLARLTADAGTIKFSGFDRILLFALALSAASIFILGLTPEIFFDSLVYHLGTPAYYINEGRVLASHDNLHSASPLLMQMIYAAGLLLSDDTLPKLLHLASGLFLCGTLFAMGRRYGSVTAGLAACLIFCSVPMMGMNLGTTGVEIGSAWFTALAAYALFLFSAREGGEARLLDRTLLLAGVFAGLASGTKYPALFTVVAGMAVIFLRRPSEGGGRSVTAFKQAVVFGVAAGLVFSPWLIKNLAFHGNPLYPYFAKIFGGQLVDPFKWAVLNSDCFSRDLRAAFGSLAGFGQFLFHPWYLTMSGAGNADFLGPFILLCAPLPFLFRLEKPALRHLALYVAIMWGLWAFSTSMPRYMIPTLALMSLLFSVLIAGAADKALKWTMLGLLLVVSLYSAQWVNKIDESQEGWQVVFGLQPKAEYLAVQHSTYPAPYYAAMEYMNAALPADSRVLFVGESRGFYCERKFTASSVYDENPLFRFAGASATPEELQAKLKAAGYTHLFLNLAEGMRLKDSYRLLPWTEESIKVFNGWWAKYVSQLWSDVRQTQRDYRLLFVYTINDAPGAGPAAQNHLYDIYLRSQKK